MTFVEAIKKARHNDTLISEDGFECYVHHVGGRHYAFSFGVMGIDNDPAWVPVDELDCRWSIRRARRRPARTGQ